MNEVRPPASLATLLLTAYALIFVLLIGLFGYLTLSGVESVLREQAVTGLARQTRAVQLGFEGVAVSDLQSVAVAHSEALEARLTIVAADGTVLADTDFDPEGMLNHGTRPEVVEALNGEVGVDSRVSDTTGAQQTYVAIRGDDGLVYRLSITEEAFGAQITEIASRIGLAALIAGVLGVGLVALVGRRIARPIQELTGIAREVSEGRLEQPARRSRIRELDRLGVSIGLIARELGNRVIEAEDEREILEALLDALPQGVILVAADESILYGNGTVRGIIGEVPARLSQLTPHAMQRLVRETMASRDVHDETIESTDAGPTLRALSSPLPDGRVLLVVSDITERVRVEAMRRDFVADASHELKTPIASILAASETLQMALEHDPDRAARFVTLVHESAIQLARIVGDLLDLSRLETSSGGDELVRLDRVVVEELDQLRASAADKGIDLLAELTPAVVLGSGSDLALAVRNLVANAIRYSSEGQHVTVGMRQENATVRLFVADTGAGIPQRSVNRVFERFYRVDVARSRETGGTGLGLAIVKHVAEAHGGSVSVESELGVGSTFHVTLPLVDAST
jgi:two-component system, OmpR family, phosphate regulon sensor histidine kinase PhoR